MVTDPPYGVGYDPNWRARGKLDASKRARGKVLNDDRADWREAYALFPGDVAYVWHGALHGDVIAADLAGCGLQPRAQIIWSKQHFTLGRGDYHWKHETCWYAVRDGKTSHWQGDPHPDDGLGDSEQQSVWQPATRAELGARHSKTGGDRQQQPTRPGGL